jgi:hypothetical protein
MSAFKKYLEEERVAWGRSIPAGIKIINQAKKELGELQAKMGPDSTESLRRAINLLDEAAKLLT